jgi:hypothetical protein
MFPLLNPTALVAIGVDACDAITDPPPLTILRTR